MNRKLLYLQTAGMAPNLRVLLAWYVLQYFLLLLLLLIVSTTIHTFCTSGIFIGIHDAAQTAKISACYTMNIQVSSNFIDPHFQFKYCMIHTKANRKEWCRHLQNQIKIVFSKIVLKINYKTSSNRQCTAMTCV